MTEKDRKDTIKAIKKVRRELKGNSKASREFLHKAGIATKSGKLTKAYGG